MLFMASDPLSILHSLCPEILLEELLPVDLAMMERFFNEEDEEEEVDPAQTYSLND